MKKPARNQNFRRSYAFAVAVLIALPAFAQQEILVQNFKVSPENYPAPNERQMKSLLEGTTGRAEPGGIYLVTGARLRTFEPSGKPDLEITTPQCRYDHNRRQVRSDQPLKLRTADGSFSIEGRGFQWSQTNSSLLISNEVRTLLQPALAKQNQTNQNKSGQLSMAGDEPIEIRSDSFSYESESGLGIYDGHVRVTGTNLSLIAGKLTLEIPVRDKQLRNIRAEKDLVLDHGEIHATGQQALYSMDTGILEVEGDPSWKTEFREGGGNYIRIDRTNGVFETRGDARLRLWGPELRSSALIPQAGKAEPSPADTAVGREISVKAGTYIFRTNSARFQDQVVVEQKTAGQPPATLHASTLDLEFEGTNQLKRVLAHGDVVLRSGTNEFHAGEATVSGTNRLLTLLVEPRWKSGERSGHGNRIEVDSFQEQMKVSGDAVLELPARELASAGYSGLRPSRASTNTVSKPTAAQARIYASEYSLAREKALFTGGVRIEHPQMRWSCPILAVTLPKGDEQEAEMIAEPQVSFEVTSAKGEKLMGSCDRAVYRRSTSLSETNSMMELTGTPTVLTLTNGMMLRNPRVLLDLGNSRFIVPAGNYRILGPTNSSSANLFPLPGKNNPR